MENLKSGAAEGMSSGPSRSTPVNADEVQDMDTGLSFEEVVDLKNDLSQAQRERFFEMMHKVVVVVKSDDRRAKKPNIGGESKERTQTGTGVLVDSNGLVLTVSHILYKSDSARITCQFMGHGDFVEAKLIRFDSKKNLALIKIAKGSQYPFCRFEYDGEVKVGCEVFGIGHPHNMNFSFTHGHITFPCDVPVSIPNRSPTSENPTCWLMGPFRAEMMSFHGEEKVRILKNYEDDLPIIAINNLHGGNGSYGSPVFDSRGRVIGIIAFVLELFDFAIHSKVLKEFIDDKKAGTEKMKSSSAKKK